MISALGLMGIMLGLTLAVNGYPAFWFVFLVGLFVLLTGFIMWLSEYFPMTSEENAEIETYHPPLQASRRVNSVPGFSY